MQQPLREGIPVHPVAYYKLLSTDAAFCEQLGRAVLAAGRLETVLATHVVNIDINKAKKPTLGKIIELLKKNDSQEKLIRVLEMLKTQRNYLTHNLYALFFGFVDETILPRTELLDSDIESFTDRAWQLAENLNSIADSVIEKQGN